jgi:hypothetical protein
LKRDKVISKYITFGRKIKGKKIVKKKGWGKRKNIYINYHTSGVERLMGRGLTWNS